MVPSDADRRGIVGVGSFVCDAGLGCLADLRSRRSGFTFTGFWRRCRMLLVTGLGYRCGASGFSDS